MARFALNAGEGLCHSFTGWKAPKGRAQVQIHRVAPLARLHLSSFLAAAASFCARAARRRSMSARTSRAPASAAAQRSLHRASRRPDSNSACASLFVASASKLARSCRKGHHSLITDEHASARSTSLHFGEGMERPWYVHVGQTASLLDLSLAFEFFAH